MAITKSAKKTIRASKRKRVFNIAKKDYLSKPVKQFKKLVLAKDIKGAEKVFPLVQKALDKATKTGLIKKNTASRRKSRFSAMMKKVG